MTVKRRPVLLATLGVCLFMTYGESRAAVGPVGAPTLKNKPFTVWGVKSRCDVWVTKRVLWVRCTPAAAAPAPAKKTKPVGPAA